MFGATVIADQGWSINRYFQILKPYDHIEQTERYGAWEEMLIL